MAALDSECVILEISYCRFDENDIVHIEDDYQRAAAPKREVEAA